MKIKDILLILVVLIIAFVVFKGVKFTPIGVVTPPNSSISNGASANLHGAY